MTTRLLRLAAAAAAVAAVVAACSSDDSSSDAAPPAATSAATTSAAAPAATSSAGSAPAPATATIMIKGFKYGAPLTVKPGTTITVTNEDGAGHDVVSDDAGKFRTATLAQGESATFTAPAEPGTYKYSCSLHPASMSGIGTLIVQA